MEKSNGGEIPPEKPPLRTITTSTEEVVVAPDVSNRLQRQLFTPSPSESTAVLREHPQKNSQQHMSHQLQPPLPPPRLSHPILLKPESPESRPRPNIEVKDGIPKKQKQCNCERSRCLKLYCECFASGIYCDGCNCVNCFNNVEHEAPRQEAVELTVERYPNAFRPKFASSPHGVRDSKDNKQNWSVSGVMENKDLEGSHKEKISWEVNLQDMNDDGEHLFVLDSTPKLQFRKEVSKGRWDAELGMSEIIEMKGGMWTTMGIVRKNNLYCSIEETLFLAERGAILLVDANDTILSLKDIYEMVGEEKNGCSWESFKAFRHLKSLGYIVGRHGIPWTLKNDKSCCNSTCGGGLEESNGVSDMDLEVNVSINCLFADMQINELKLAFDVYLPNSKFRKSSPGDPDFVLCLVRDPPSKVEIEDLERACNGVPLKICNVEHGLVSFFSFNSIELPALP